MSASLEELVIVKTHRLPSVNGPAGDGSVAARQFDAVLMGAGFKLSGDLLGHLSGLSEGTVIDTAVRVLPIVRREVGDHVRHNVYFRDFPANVPDTLTFWVRCVTEALLDPVVQARGGAGTLVSGGSLNLLALPSYGRYLHSFEEMLAAHDDLIPSAGDRVTVLHLGGTLDDEVSGLYLSLAASRTPLGEDDLGALATLAEHCADGPQPETIPIRENRALINQVRLTAGSPLLVDTVTDVLRLACALSGGDVTLQDPTRFRSLPRPARRQMLAALDEVIRSAPAKLGDVGAHREQWKRLGERLHPHEFPQWPHAAQVFAVARGEQAAASFSGRVEAALGAGNITGAVSLLGSAPGILFRSLDRLLRATGSAGEQAAVLDAAGKAVGAVSGRVVLSVREHLANRANGGVSRVFANRKGRAWVAADTRTALDAALLERLFTILDADVARRLPKVGHLVIDPAVLGVALPLSGKTAPGGFGVLPRGSVSDVEGDLLRFFVYWKEHAQRTDYDLSALLLDADYRNAEWLSWTNLTHLAGEHSGDITSAPDGASEFINLDLRRVWNRFVIPQVNVYSGEGFDETEESFFGFMLRDREQQGQPFEAATVRMKSDLRGPGRVALPMVFMRGEDGQWRAKWLHLFAKGHVNFNQVEGNHVTTSLLMRGIVEREYLRVRYLTDMLAAAAETVTVHGDGPLPDGPVTFIGLDRPEGLHAESEVYTLYRLADLIPA